VPYHQNQVYTNTFPPPIPYAHATGTFPLQWCPHRSPIHTCPSSHTHSVPTCHGSCAHLCLHHLPLNCGFTHNRFHLLYPTAGPFSWTCLYLVCSSEDAGRGVLFAAAGSSLTHHFVGTADMPTPGVQPPVVQTTTCHFAIVPMVTHYSLHHPCCSGAAAAPRRLATQPHDSAPYRARANAILPAPHLPTRQ